VTRRHFAARGVQAECVKLSGAMELAPSLGLSHRIVDLVIRPHAQGKRPVEIEHVADITSRFIVNRAALKTQPERVGHWVDRFREVSRAPKRGRFGRRSRRVSKKEFSAFLGRNRDTDENVDASRRHRGRCARPCDAAVLEYTRKFDKSRPTRAGCAFRCRTQGCRCEVATVQREALAFAAQRIEPSIARSCQERRFTDATGTRLGARYRRSTRSVSTCRAARRPILSLLMNIVPAKVAGVGRIVMVVPTRAAFLTVVMLAAEIAGADEVWPSAARRRGGAGLRHAVDQPVDKITGPGMPMSAAKRRVFGQVGIDLIAGPRDKLVVADRRTTA